MMEPPHKSKKLDYASPLNPVHKPITPADHEIVEKDLPLLANVDVVRVCHYLMKLTTNFALRRINGTAILFLEWANSIIAAKEIILDACYLQVKQVTILRTIQEFNVHQSQLYLNTSGDRKDFYKSSNDDNWFAQANEPSRQLQFEVKKWSLNISGWENCSSESLPSVIRIDYVTLENSPSIHWRTCDGFRYEPDSLRKCLYSPAPPVNNRGLFPCQEPPSALATWEVLMQVENEYTPLLTSDKPGEIISIGEETSIHYFYSSIPLPMSTFALVVGQYYLQTTLISSPVLWPNCGVFSNDACKNHIKYPCRFNGPKQSKEVLIPVRLFSLDKDCVSTLSIEKLASFMENCLKTCSKHFGPHPFDRLDVVIMPKCFPHMGLANPSMMFLSPSNFTETTEPLFVCRIPHEICHSWFGLLIGAVDWTEEWLSEGFATFSEDIVFKETYSNYFPQRTSEEVRKEHALKICLRFITLQSELENTDNELHVMKTESEDNYQTAKNGLIPIKQFMHLHYYKGYLLLWQLSCLVGHENFSQFLREYVWRYHGQLVTSEIFLASYFEKFKETLNVNPDFPSLEKVKSDWLENDTLPAPYNKLNLLKTEILELTNVPIFNDAVDALRNIKAIFELMKSQPLGEELDSLTCTEILILLEHILSIGEEKPVLMSIYKQLCCSSGFKLHLQNPEVLHRYCELIILCKDMSQIGVVKGFLQNHIAMGVYLYGELMISEKLSYQKLAKRLFRKLEKVYDLGTERILKEMLF